MRDALLIFGDEVAVLGAEVETDTLEIEYPNKGEGTVLWWHILVTTLFEGGTSLVFTLRDSDDDATYRDAILTNDIVLADLVVGKEVVIGMRYDSQEYWKVAATPTGTFTAGEFSSWVEID